MVSLPLPLPFLRICSTAAGETDKVFPRQCPPTVSISLWVNANVLTVTCAAPSNRYLSSPL